MVDGADYVIGSDMPICPCTANSIPNKLISYTEAKHIHKLHKHTDPQYHINAFIHFYIDDQKFDGPQCGIWRKPFEALEIIRHFSGSITPDFSTNADFPDSLKRSNTYRMRAFGRWLTTNNISVINNVRWGTEETWDYCFDGIPYNSIVAIGTVASGLHKLSNRPDFEKGLFKMVELLKPHTILVYGSTKYDCFKILSDMNIRIVPYISDTNLAFLSRKGGDKSEQTK